MFSAGIAQQMIRRQERMSRAMTHLQKGDPQHNNAANLVPCACISHTAHALSTNESLFSMQ